MTPDAVTGPPQHGVTVGRRETDGSEIAMSKTGAGSHRYSVRRDRMDLFKCT